MKTRAGKSGASMIAAFGVIAALSFAHASKAENRNAVILDTEAGPIFVMLNTDEAPITTCNFIRYMLRGEYSDATFFRTVVRETDDNPTPIDVIQAATVHGSDDASHPPIPLERTRDTGLSHKAGVISMARDGPDTATSSFFIVVEDTPSLDSGGGRHPDGQGFAAFGQVVEGMEIVRRIQAAPAVDETLVTPVNIRAVHLMGPNPDHCLQ